MKKNFCTANLIRLVLAAAVFFVTGCASTKKQDSALKTPEDIQRFDDWQYRGFGKEYPEWAQLVLDEKFEELKDYFSYINKDGLDLCVIKVDGTDSDMCRHKINEVSYTEEEAWLIEETWVRLNEQYYGQLENPYVYIRIFLTGNKE
ncbi:MAG: hypothetical protein J5726_00070 [Treponema sp.]|nr:hypothetical protein [Treponema sp.]